MCACVYPGRAESVANDTMWYLCPCSVALVKWRRLLGSKQCALARNAKLQGAIWLFVL